MSRAEDAAALESLLRMGGEVETVVPLEIVDKGGAWDVLVGYVMVGKLTRPTNGHPPGVYLFMGEGLLAGLQSCEPWLSLVRTISSHLRSTYGLKIK